jgi:glycosyltransferase involved in cell wall biosynthesis
MKFFFDATVLELPATGIGKTTLQLYESCINQMDSLEITALHQNPLSVNLPPKIQSAQLGEKFSSSIWRSVYLPAHIQKNNPDIIHFPWNGNVPRFLTKKNIITSIHDILPLIIPEYFNSLSDEAKYKERIQKDINRSELIITVSNYSKKEIIANFEVNNEILVLHHGPTIQPSPERFKHKKSDYFLYVGGYDPRKGLETLLERFILLHEEKKLESRLVMVGDKNYYSPYFKKLVETGIEKGFVEERGYVSDEELAKLYSNAIALVYPSKYEGFGLPPLEAMNLGCPVITTKCTSIPEICGNATYYVNIDEPHDLDEAIVTLENDLNIRKKLCLMGKKQASNFSWENSARSFINKITEIIS